ncbi:MAG: LD-carboxypeptidase [Calditrichaeota bacterium]|nr:MAG: LD-carboxypeptidase [Calditrichota bacterium]MBL1206572.1 LD-carboxypeptidase [Calditrichota bacterium]NOG46399.1 LD-carboxypeptidase [Calditrichota bacterium]
MLKKIAPGSTISVIAPAYPPNPEKTELGITYLESKGYEVVRNESLKGNHGYFSAPDEQRIKELNESFANPNVDAIICARGGWGNLRLLDKIDYKTIKQNPKLLVGYSDITTLQLAIWQKCEIPSISGPMVAVEMASGILDFTEKYFWEQIDNPEKNYSINLAEIGTENWNDGQSHGTLLGGCLSMVAHQLGTPYSPNYDGSILFIEDVGEVPYKIDRYLAQMKQAGILDSISGLIIGEFLDCESDDEDSFSVEEILHDYFDNLKCPVIYNFPYGHGMKKISMPIGSKTSLDTKKGKLEFENIFNS